MTTVEKIRALCKEKKIPISRLEHDLSFGNGFLNPKKAMTISFERLQLVAEYLGTPIEYFSENKNTAESVDSAVQDDMQLMREKIANLSQDQLAVLLQEIAKKLGEG